MRSRRTLILAAVASALLLALAGWYYASPYWTLRQMAAAAKAKDADALSSHVDYPALRSDLRADFTARLEAEAAKDGSPAARLGLAMGKAMLGPLVDTFVSPAGLRTVISHYDPDSVPAKAAGQRAGAKKELPEVERLSLNRFRVSDKKNPGAGLVFERRGISWKLVGVDLPPPVQRSAL